MAPPRKIRDRERETLRTVKQNAVRLTRFLADVSTHVDPPRCQTSTSVGQEHGPGHTHVPWSAVLAAITTPSCEPSFGHVPVGQCPLPCVAPEGTAWASTVSRLIGDTRLEPSELPAAAVEHQASTTEVARVSSSASDIPGNFDSLRVLTRPSSGAVGWLRQSSLVRSSTSSSPSMGRTPLAGTPTRGSKRSEPDCVQELGVRKPA